MHRGRQLAPIAKTREETTSLLRDLRMELAALETAQQSMDSEKSFQNSVNAKISRKSKSVLAQRLLEQHRLQARQRHIDEAVEHAARVHDFNTAMREQAQTHIQRLVVQREFVHSTQSAPIALYAQHASLDLPAEGDLAHRPDLSRPESDRKMKVASISIKRELGTMKNLLRDLLESTASRLGGNDSNFGPARPSSANGLRAGPTSMSADAVISAMANVSHAVDASVELAQRKAEERLARLEEAERQRKRLQDLKSAGSLGTDEALVDGRLVRDANQRDHPVVFAASAALKFKSLSESSKAGTTEEQRSLAILGQREKLGAAINAQRGYIRRLRERLTQLEADDASVAGAPVPCTSATEQQPSPAEEAKCSPPLTNPMAEKEADQYTPTVTQPPTQQAASEANNEVAASTVMLHDQGADSPEINLELRTFSEERARSRRVEELRALCAELQNARASKDALEVVQGRLILALSRELTEAAGAKPPEKSAVSIVVTAFFRGRLSAQETARKWRRVNEAALRLQSAMRIPCAKHRAKLRQEMTKKMQRWYPNATLQDIAVIELQSWARGHLARNPRGKPSFASRREAYRQARNAIKLVESSVLIQSVVRRRLCSKPFRDRLQLWRKHLSAEAEASQKAFEAEQAEGFW